ncbi:hypothetical protein ATG70_3274 [Bacillus sp. es.036]|nr:hypothetical protein ATG70_3274 [Bacillus sp. es.036]
MKKVYEAPQVLAHQMIQFETTASGKKDKDKDKDDKKKGF